MSSMNTMLSGDSDNNSQRADDLRQRREAAARMRAQQLEALEKVRKKKLLRRKKVLLYNKAREQQKVLLKKSCGCPEDSPLKRQIQAMIDSVAKTLSGMERELGVEENASTRIQTLQRRCLEIELEIYSRQQKKQDASQQKWRLAQTQQYVALVKHREAVLGPLTQRRLSWETVEEELADTHVINPIVITVNPDSSDDEGEDDAAKEKEDEKAEKTEKEKKSEETKENISVS